MLKDRPEKRFSHVVCVENQREEKTHAIINFLDHHQSANGSCQNKSEPSTSKNWINLSTIFWSLFQKKRWSLIQNFCLKNSSRTNWDNENLWPAIKNYNLRETLQLLEAAAKISFSYLLAVVVHFKAELQSVEFPLSNRGSYGGSKVHALIIYLDCHLKSATYFLVASFKGTSIH